MVHQTTKILLLSFPGYSRLQAIAGLINYVRWVSRKSNWHDFNVIQCHCGRQVALAFPTVAVYENEQHRVTTISMNLYRSEERGNLRDLNAGDSDSPRHAPQEIQVGEWTFTLLYEPGEDQGHPGIAERPTLTYASVSLKPPSGNVGSASGTSAESPLDHGDWHARISQKALPREGKKVRPAFVLNRWNTCTHPYKDRPELDTKQSSRAEIGPGCGLGTSYLIFCSSLEADQQVRCRM
ncbi:hypothetical protein BDZ45DRAFT_754499 [Acephala macrosclerotiorum]|nr:hypothetical protein BDZ45DRAFT_754499 [Acephala macrosclerotiorum]